MRRRVSVWMALTGLLFAATCLPAAESPLAAIPDSTGVVIRLKQPNATTTKLADLVKQVAPPFGDMVQQNSAAIGVLISNPTMAGVDQERDWWVAVFVAADAEPGVVFAIPASDMDAMKAALGDGVAVTTHDDWVLYSEDRAAVAKIETHLKASGSSISSVIDAKSQAVFDRGEVAAFVNVKQLAETYQQQLEAADAEVDDFLGGIAEAVPETAGMNMEAVFKMYAQMAHGLLQGVRDARGFTLAVNFGPDDIGIEEFLTVASGSATDQFLSAHPTDELTLMTKLPAEELGYFAMHGGMEQVMKWSMELSTSMFGENNPEAAEKLQAHMNEFMKLEFGTIAGSFSLGNLQDGALRASTLVEVTPADKMRDLSLRSTELMTQMQFQGIKQTMTVLKDAEKFGDYSADMFTFKQEVDENLDPFGVQKKVNQAIYGPTGMKTRLIATDKLAIQAVGNDRQVMQKTLDALDRSDADAASAHEALLATRKHLPAKGNLVGLIDLPRLAARIATLVAESGEVPIPVSPEMIEGLQLKPTYLGFAVAAEPQSLRIKTSLPVSQLQEIYKIVGLVQQIMMQRPEL